MGEGDHVVELQIPLPPSTDRSQVDRFELTTELIGNRDGYWYEYSVAFRRFSLVRSQGVTELVELRDLTQRQ